MGSRAEVASSISSTSGLDGQGAGDAQALLLAARQAQGGLFQPVFHLVPDGGLTQGLLHHLVQGFSLLRTAVGAGAVGHVVVDGHGEGVGLLEHHADAPAQVGDVHAGGVDLLARGKAREPVIFTLGMRSFIRSMVRRKVDLPQPEGPMRAVILLALMSMEMSFSAWFSP